MLDQRYWCIYPMSRTGKKITISTIPVIQTSLHQCHRRMVCSVAWGEDSLGARCNLFTAGFDRVVYGWSVHSDKEGKD